MEHLRQILQISLSALLAGFILFSCSESKDEIGPVEIRVNERIDPVFFIEEIIPIFDQHCLYCHSEEHTMHHHYKISPYLTASEAYYELISGGYVDTISPEQSLLYLKVAGTTAGIRMPPSGKLSDYEIQKILGWINYGAPNN